MSLVLISHVLNWLFVAVKIFVVMALTWVDLIVHQVVEKRLSKFFPTPSRNVFSAGHSSPTFSGLSTPIGRSSACEENFEDGSFWRLAGPTWNPGTSLWSPSIPQNPLWRAPCEGAESRKTHLGIRISLLRPCRRSCSSTSRNWMALGKILLMAWIMTGNTGLSGPAPIRLGEGAILLGKEFSGCSGKVEEGVNVIIHR